MKPRVPRVRVTPTFVTVFQSHPVFSLFQRYFERWKAIVIVALIGNKDKDSFQCPFLLLLLALSKLIFHARN